jgi:triacylglycerol lipase
MLEKAIDAIDTVQDPGEKTLVLHSRVTGPISRMTFIERSLLFAEISMVSYNDLDEATRAAKILGFEDLTFFEHHGSQAYRLRNEHDCVIACRGTEPNEWNDIRADANVVAVLAETAGKVHRGFKTEVDDLWPMLETALVSNVQPLYICGHSLGGAMATICALRCYLSHIDTNPVELFTFGSPRVGNSQYLNYVHIEHFRYVNNNDVVTRVPPVWMGYRHAGYEVYLNRDGNIMKYGHIAKRRDRWKGFLRGLRRWNIDHFVDHSIHAYIKAILNEIAEERERTAIGKPPLGPAAFVKDFGRKSGSVQQR